MEILSIFKLFYVTPITRFASQLKIKNMDTTKMIKAYCLKTKEKNVPMHDAVVSKTAKGGYIAKGNDGKGNKMAAIMGEKAALQAIKDGVAKQEF